MKYKPYLISIGIPVFAVGFLALFALYVNHKTTETRSYVDEKFDSFIFLGAPTSTAMRNVIPATDNKFDIGTSTPLLRWKNVFAVTASSTNLIISGLSGSTQCLQVSAVGTVSGTGSGCSGGGVSYDAWTHPSIGISATTSQMIFSGASSTFSGNLSITGNATTTQATTTQFAISSIASSLIVTGASGQALAYAGAACTNQFIRSLSALGAATCATVVAGDVDLADLTATNGTLTFSGAYDGSTARTIGLNLGNANTWTALQGFSLGLVGASSTFTGDLQIVKLFASSSAIINGSSTIQNVLNVGGVDGTASSTFNTGIKLKSGCYETATSSCLTNTGGFTFSIASSTMSTSTRARQFRLPVDFDITKVSCVTYGASAAIQLDERAATTPQTAGTNVLSAALTCTTSGASTQTFTNRFITQDAFLNLQITDAQPGVSRPTILEVHIYGEKVQ